jgi:hypothetical protein
MAVLQECQGPHVNAKVRSFVGGPCNEENLDVKRMHYVYERLAVSTDPQNANEQRENPICANPV